LAARLAAANGLSLGIRLFPFRKKMEVKKKIRAFAKNL
jgi:hypothetical protein